MAVKSAGILLYKREGGELRVLLVHPGGPFWAKKDAGAWSIPKGEYSDGEDPEAAARREFAEELGVALEGELQPLGRAIQPSRKRVVAFAAEGELDVAAIHSSSFEIEWPPKSGRRQSFPEVDRAGWFTLDEAGEKLLPGQRIFLDRLARLAREETPASPPRSS
jgi:predicted NUDIX family NTP pyrophosphohydrolase